MPDDARELDLVLFGATGFTGALTADYLAEHGPTDLRWALAGRSLDKLEKERDRLGRPTRARVADSADPTSLADLARRTKVVITTVGPYVDRGEALAGACAEAGTDYCDITGEGEFVDRVYVAHHATAASTGARLVHCCGFDSVPHDLGAMYTVEQLPGDVPITVRGVVRAGALPSGGTFETTLTGMSRVRQIRAAAAARRRLETAGRPLLAGRGRHAAPRLGAGVLAAAAADDRPGDRRSQRRGPAVVRSRVPLLPLRRHEVAAVRRRRRRRDGRPRDGLPGEARARLPDEQAIRRATGPTPLAASAPGSPSTSWARAAASGAHAGLRRRPGYTETAMMLAESALCLAFDDNPDVAGQVTTAQAMGAHLLTRVQAGGLTFEVR